MSYTYLLEQGEESSAASFSDIPAFVLSRLNPIPGRCCSSGSATESCPVSQFGTILPPSTGDHGADSWTWSVAGSLVRISAQQERVQDSAGSVLDCGPKWPGSFAKWDRNSCSWKTRQYSLLGGLESFLETWPKWGMMCHGECWERPTLGHRTKGTESGSPALFATPAANMQGEMMPARAKELGWEWMGTYYRKPKGVKANTSLTHQVHAWPTPTASVGGVEPEGKTGRKLVTQVGGSLNPAWVEWLMGWPLGWTDLKPLEMAKFQQWLHSHGEPLA